MYDLAQALFSGRCRERLRPWLADTAGGRVLDVGAGTGLVRQMTPPTSQYLWLDNDPAKLRGYRRRYPNALSIVANGGHLPLADRSVDTAVCVAVTHHLADPDLASVVAELARVARGRVVFLDAVRRRRAPVSQLLWRCDAGSYPRFPQALLQAIESSFEIEHFEQYRILHEYLLCVGRPKRPRE